MAKSHLEILLRIIVLDPPAGVTFAIQCGKAELVTSTMATGTDLSFELMIQIDTKEDEHQIS